MYKSKIATLLLLFTTFGLAGCKVTGGGRIVSEYDRATFGFNANSCSGQLRGQFTLVNNNVDPKIRLSAEVTDVMECLPGDETCNCDLGETFITADYTSNNKQAPGAGELEVCVFDGGEGQGAVDSAEVRILTGPFGGYQIEGTVQGNVQEHDCN